MGTDAPSLERLNVSDIFVHTGFWQIDRTLRFVGLWLAPLFLAHCPVMLNATAAKYRSHSSAG